MPLRKVLISFFLGLEDFLEAEYCVVTQSTKSRSRILIISWGVKVSEDAGSISLGQPYGKIDIIN